jgi:hypothetical protein
MVSQSSSTQSKQQAAVVEPSSQYSLPQVLLVGYNQSSTAAAAANADAGSSASGSSSNGFLLSCDTEGEWQWFQQLTRSARATALSVVVSLHVTRTISCLIESYLHLTAVKRPISSV